MSSSNPTIPCNFSDPLFSALLTFSSLVLLCFPRLLWRLLLSPALLLAGFLLLSLLRIGANQRFPRHTNDKNQTVLSEVGNRASTAPEEDRAPDDAVESKLEGGGGGGGGGSENDVSVPCARFEESFVQWNVWAPLEVIYEDYEEEVSNESDPFIERYPSLSLSLYYPETDSDSSSGDEFPAAGAWDSVDDLWNDGEELIEIALDKRSKMKGSPELFQLEEENLIEIDISPTRSGEFPGEVLGSINVD